MSDVVDITIETVNLERKFSELMGVLVGKGQPGDLGKAISVEAGQCAFKIAAQIGPRSSAEATRRLNKDLKQYLTTVPRYSNLSESQQYSSWGDFKWVQAGPHFVLGIATEDDQINADASQVLEIYHASRANHLKLGPAYQIFGRIKKGHQFAIKMNRTRVSPATFKAVRTAIAERFGQSKAAWLRVAQKYLPNRRLPGWVTAQIERVIANGKSVLIPQYLETTRPSITFGSRAPGVESNPKMRAAIAAGALASRKTLEAKVRKVIAGQTYNWNTGQVFRPTQFEDN